MNKINSLVVVLLLLSSTSCVTKKKYLLAENGRLDALQREEVLKQKLSDCQDENDKLSERIAQLKSDTADMGRNIRSYRTMLNANLGEQDKLNALLSTKMQELEEREKTINQLQDMMNAQNEKVQNILQSVKDALMGFSSDELSV